MVLIRVGRGEGFSVGRERIFCIAGRMGRGFMKVLTKRMMPPPGSRPLPSILIPAGWARTPTARCCLSSLYR